MWRETKTPRGGSDKAMSAAHDESTHPVRVQFGGFEALREVGVYVFKVTCIVSEPHQRQRKPCRVTYESFALVQAFVFSSIEHAAVESHQDCRVYGSEYRYGVS